MTDLARPSQTLNLRPSVGLLLSIGDIVETTKNGRTITYPKKLDHFRAKPGQLGQYTDAADKFHEVYGPEPRQVDDAFFLSNAIGDVLDVRRKVWGTSGLKAYSATNFATYDPEIFRERLDAWDDELIVIPDDKPELGSYQLKGPQDPAIERGKMKVYATLRVCLPRVTGMGQVVEITTTGRRSTDNLFASLTYARGILRGNLIGVPFRLTVRPARMRYFDKQEGKRKSTEFFELVLDTPLTMAELFEAVREQASIGQASAGVLALPTGPAPEPSPDPSEYAEFFDSDARKVDDAIGHLEPPDDGGPDDGEVLEGEVVEESGQASFADMVPNSARDSARAREEGR